MRGNTSRSIYKSLRTVQTAQNRDFAKALTMGKSKTQHAAAKAVSDRAPFLFVFLCKVDVFGNCWAVSECLLIQLLAWFLQSKASALDQLLIQLLACSLQSKASASARNGRGLSQLVLNRLSQTQVGDAFADAWKLEPVIDILKEVALIMCA